MWWVDNRMTGTIDARASAPRIVKAYPNLFLDPVGSHVLLIAHFPFRLFVRNLKGFGDAADHGGMKFNIGRQVPVERDGEAVARVAKEVARLDSYSFWTVPADPATAADIVVTGITGVFLIAAVGAEGVLHLEKRPSVGDQELPLKALKAGAKQINSALSTSSVVALVESVFVMTKALAGPPASSAGVRFVKVVDLLAELTSRPKSVTPERARQVARVLGMQLAGDKNRHFTIHA
jgi:hypothetical protein